MCGVVDECDLIVKGEKSLLGLPCRGVDEVDYQQESHSSVERSRLARLSRMVHRSAYTNTYRDWNKPPAHSLIDELLC